jgi:hypothetical protein
MNTNLKLSPMKDQFKELYHKSLSEFDHEKSDLLDVMGIKQERAEYIKSKLIEILDKDVERDNSELLQEALYEAEPQNVKEILLLGYMVGVLEHIDQYSNDNDSNYDYRNFIY